MSQPETNKVPQIRFKGVTGEWQLKNLSNLIALENGLAFKSRYFSETPTKTIVVTPGNVKIGGGFQSGKGQFYLENTNILGKYVFDSGDIFVTMTDLTPTSQALGFPAVVPKDNNTYLHNQRLGKLAGYQGHEGFLFHLLCVPKGQKQVVSTASGTTVKHTSPSKFLNRDFYFPIKEEQAKVGGFFQKLDDLIQQHQQKHDKLVTLKQAMLQRMFPQPGATTPEIRFKGFEGEWVKHSLKNFADITTGFPFKSSDFSDSGAYLVVTNGNIQNELTFVDSAVGNRINIQNSSGLNQFILRVGDILVTMDGSVGRTAKVRETNQILAQRVGRLVAKSDAEFLYQALNTGEFLKEMTSISHGGTIKHISLSEIGDYIFLAPSDLAEQQKISHYFRQLDELINRHATQLEKLKQLKAACLEKMFV